MENKIQNTVVPNDRVRLKKALLKMSRNIRGHVGTCKEIEIGGVYGPCAQELGSWDFGTMS